MTEQTAPAQLPRWITDHIELYRTDPERAHLWDSTAAGGKGKIATLLLTAKGRKSGRDISIPLIYGRHGAAYVVIASKGGAPDHPAWFKNLLANPVCGIRVARDGYEAVARVASGDERTSLWAQMQLIYPPYDDYQRVATGREIPVVVLEPHRPLMS